MSNKRKKWEYEYLFIEDADEKLRERCIKGLDERYIDQKRAKAEKRIEEELVIISRQGSASAYLTLLDVLDSVGFTTDDICIRGTAASSLVVHVTGLSGIDPLESRPALYPEFYFGYDGARPPAFEMNVSPELQDRLLDYYKHYSGEQHLTYRFDEHDQSLGVFIGDFNEDEIITCYSIGVFRLLFRRMGERNRKLSDFVKEEIIGLCDPKTFTDYVRCYGLTHGTDVWEENMESLLRKGILLPEELIADREDVYEYLMKHGFEKRTAFEMTDEIRKGRICRDGWKQEQLEIMGEKEVPEWFIESCTKIKYLFPRAHAMAFLKTYCNMEPEKQDT